MTAKQYCLNNSTIGYYSGFGGVEIHGFTYDTNNYVYCVSGAWSSSESFHKLKIYYSSGLPYFKLCGVRIYLNDCIRTNI